MYGQNRKCLDAHGRSRQALRTTLALMNPRRAAPRRAGSGAAEYHHQHAPLVEAPRARADLHPLFEPRSALPHVRRAGVDRVTPRRATHRAVAPTAALLLATSLPGGRLLADGLEEASEHTGARRRTGAAGRPTLAGVRQGARRAVSRSPSCRRRRQVAVSYLVRVSPATDAPAPPALRSPRSHAPPADRSTDRAAPARDDAAARASPRTRRR